MNSLHERQQSKSLFKFKTGPPEFFAIDPVAFFLSNSSMNMETAALYRVIFSLGGLIFFLLIGFLFPFRKNSLLKDKYRLSTNIFINFSNGILIYLFIPITLIEISLFTKESGFGLLNHSSLSLASKVILEVILLDLIIYWQHRFTHKIPLLWLFHRVHHSDTEFDTTTAGRFHFIETLFSFFIKALFTILFGFSALSLIIFEILLNFSSLFNHSNFSLPKPLEKVFRYFVVTPDMHRVHHSVIIKETDSNFGFCISLWDKIFKSYIAKPKNDPKSMDIGLEYFRKSTQRNLIYILKIPFLKKE